MDSLPAFEKIAPYLTHPLVLVGFALLLAFSIHRALIKSGIIPPLSQRGGSAVVQAILKYGFQLALAVVVLGFGVQFFEGRELHIVPAPAGTFNRTFPARQDAGSRAEASPSKSICNSALECGKILGFDRELDGRNDFAKTNAQEACKSKGKTYVDHHLQTHPINCGLNYGLVQWNGTEFVHNEVPICKEKRVTVIDEIVCQ